MFSFKKGVHPNDNKKLTQDCDIEQMPLCNEYFVALSQHIGAPSECIVNVGDNVVCGQLIAGARGKISANIFSPVCGQVVAIVKKRNAAGNMGDFIHIKTSSIPQEQWQTETLPPLSSPTKEQIIDRVFDAGIVGLGGAGFATAVKMTPNKPLDTLIINAAECEPYLNCDNRLLLEHTEQVIEGIKLIAKAIGVEKIIVGIEDNKKEACQKLVQCGITPVVLNTRYPQGAEKVLIFSCTGRKVPNKGGLPMDVGVSVNNVATAYAVYDAVTNGNALYKRVLTVSGRGIGQPKNIWVLNGTPHKDIFAFCGGVKEDTVKLISGGPMMGFCLEDDEGVTTKAESGLLALSKEECESYEPTNCLNCGKCSHVCPMHLQPSQIDFYILAGDTQNAVKYGALDCFECGCCAYICPARRHLVQSMRLTKKRVREAKK